MEAEAILCIPISLGIIWICIKLMIFLWHNVIVPTGKFLFKIMSIVVILVFFVFVYVRKEAIEEFVEVQFGMEAKWILIIGLGLWAGIQHLRSR